MGRRVDLGAVVEYQGAFHEVVGIGEGRTIVLIPIGKEPCPTCGHDRRIGLLETSPLFQKEVKPVKTVEGE